MISVRAINGRNEQPGQRVADRPFLLRPRSEKTPDQEVDYITCILQQIVSCIGKFMNRGIGKTGFPTFEKILRETPVAQTPAKKHIAIPEGGQG